MRALRAKRDEPACCITLTRLTAVLHRPDVIRRQIKALQGLNYGGRLDHDIATLQDASRHMSEHWP